MYHFGDFEVIPSIFGFAGAATSFLIIKHVIDRWYTWNEYKKLMEHGNITQKTKFSSFKTWTEGILNIYSIYYHYFEL